jgi:hypothetical protein
MMMIAAKVLLNITSTEHYHHDGMPEKSPEKVVLHKY